MRSYTLASINLKTNSFKLRLTKHSREQAKSRHISEKVVKHSIAKIRLEDVLEAKKDNKDMMFNDKKNGISFVAGWLNNKTLNIVTVIDKADAVPNSKKTVRIKI